MSGIAARGLATAALLALACYPAPAAAGSISPEGLKDAYDDIKGWIDDYNEVKGNYEACLARGWDAKTCAKAALWCKISEKAVGKYYPGFVSKLKLFEAFKTDCGKGECFQCCWTKSGCHSSFVGFPVINCDAKYGPETIDAGLTLIVNPNPKPGSACLYIPQTCEHIPKCNYNGKTNIPNLITKLKSGTPHALNWKHAKSWRRTTLAKNIRTYVYKYLNAYTSEKGSLFNVFGYMTGRGCKKWGTNISTTWPMDWTAKDFEVLDSKTSKPAGAASKFNWNLQLFTLRTIAALPNLAARMDVAESMVYTAATKKAYLSAVKDVDGAFLKYASPHALAILKSVHYLQDYKLLSVPVKGEPSLAGTFNGCNLGQAPVVKLSHVLDGNLGVKVTVTVSDPEYPTTKLANPVVVLWGDGTTTRDSIQAGQSKTIAHTYALGGKYSAYVLASNDSGLRGISRLTMTTKQTAGTKAAPADVPAISRVVMEKFAVTEKSLSGNDFGNLFELWMVDGKGKERRMGVTSPKKSKLNATTQYGNFTGHNNPGLTIKKLVIKPYFYIGFAIGLKEMYITTDKLRFDVYSTEDDKFISAGVYLKPGDVKVYPKGKTTPVSAASLKYDTNGRLKIPLFTKVGYTWTVTSRVEIDVTKAMFSSLRVGPALNSTLPSGKEWRWYEPAPGTLKRIPVCNNKEVESPETCDDGNLVDGDGCSAACKLEGAPAGVTGFTARRGASGAILEWSTSGLKNCKSFDVLACQGRSCASKAAHKVLSGLKGLKCKYGAGTMSYSYLDTIASPYLMQSYYLRQHGDKSGTYTDYGPAMVAPPQPDLGPDMTPPDAGVPDLPPPDLAPLDLAIADLAAPDLPASDLTAPDQAGPDLATPDQAAPDTLAMAPDALASAPDSSTQGGEDEEDDEGCRLAGGGLRGGGLWLLLGLLLLLRRRG